MPVLRLFLRFYLFLFHRVTYIGLENIPGEGGCLLCSNHLSFNDPVMIGAKNKRLVYWMAKEELFRVPVLASIIRWLGAYPVARGKGDNTAKQKTFDLLEEGKLVGIFPVGTRAKGKDASQLKAKYGAAKFAIESGKPVLPVGVYGATSLFAKGMVVFGEPYYLEYEEGKEYTKDEYAAISQSIMDKIAVMIEEAKHEHHIS